MPFVTLWSSATTFVKESVLWLDGRQSKMFVCALRQSVVIQMYQLSVLYSCPCIKYGLFMVLASWVLVPYLSLVTCPLSLCPGRRSVTWPTCTKTFEMDTTWSRCWRSSLGTRWWVSPPRLIFFFTLARSNKCVCKLCTFYLSTILQTKT